MAAVGSGASGPAVGSRNMFGAILLILVIVILLLVIILLFMRSRGTKE